MAQGRGRPGRTFTTPRTKHAVHGAVASILVLPSPKAMERPFWAAAALDPHASSMDMSRGSLCRAVRPTHPTPRACARMSHPRVAHNPPSAAHLLRLRFLAHAWLGVQSGRALPPRQLTIHSDDSAGLISIAPPPTRHPWVPPHRQVSRMLTARSVEDQPRDEGRLLLPGLLLLLHSQGPFHR